MESLKQFDWSFADRSPAPAVEGIHPYPAKFIGDIPRTLMAVLQPPPGTVVLDPFVGSGTTLVEAQRIGFESLGIDINPIACLIARVKTSPTPDTLIATAERICEDAMRIRRPIERDIPNLNHWFRRDVQVAVSALLQTIATEAHSSSYDALRVALSSILVRVSNQESDTRYAAIDKGIGGREVFGQFLSAVGKVNSALEKRTWGLPPATVINGDTLGLLPSQMNRSVGLVITSPPYPNAYEYWLYHKYRMWWLGFDPLEVKRREIGARAHFFGSNPHTGTTFTGQMRKTLGLLNGMLDSRGFACFVVGRSKIHGKIIDNAAMLKSIATKSGFEVCGEIEREIAARRKSFNLSHAKIKTESIVVLRKVDARDD